MPIAEDGLAISKLIAECPPLDVNSAYCNLLQCTDFAATCVLAERGGRLIGWISGYRPPSEPEQLFVWQVAVHPAARGSGLGGQMLDALLIRLSPHGITRLSTTITDENKASWALFTSFARRHDAQLTNRPIFDRDVHFGGTHETEYLVSIGPFPAISDQFKKEDP